MCARRLKLPGRIDNDARWLPISQRATVSYLPSAAGGMASKIIRHIIVIDSIPPLVFGVTPCGSFVILCSK